MPGKGIIIDYGMGNLLSVKKKFDRIGSNVAISSSKKDIAEADFLILPGVGHFEAGVRNLQTAGFWDLLHGLVMEEKKPILGVCLGLQLMCKSSEEGGVDGFGWFDAEVKRFNVKDTLRYKVPHVGWNYLEQTNHSLFEGFDPALKPMYFVHAYYVEAQDKQLVAAKTTYEHAFDAVLIKDHIVGVQFHPEKSHSQGEALIQSFITHFTDV